MDHCKIEIENGIAIVEVCRPEALNALNTVTMRELLEAVSRIASNGAVRALILTGSGSKAFIAGADIKEMNSKNQAEILEFCHLGQSLTLALEEAPYPTIAAVNGYALGGGLEMALACDFIYAKAGSKLGLPEVTLGVIPGFGGTQRLARAIGTAQAKEMIFTGLPITAERALEIGLVNAVFPDEESLLAAAIKTAKRIASHSSAAVSAAKRAVNHGRFVPSKEALEAEGNSFAVAFASEMRSEAMDLFLNSRSR